MTIKLVRFCNDFRLYVSFEQVLERLTVIVKNKKLAETNVQWKIINMYSTNLYVFITQILPLVETVSSPELHLAVEP